MFEFPHLFSCLEFSQTRTTVGFVAFGGGPAATIP